MIWIDLQSCTGCGACVDTCPWGAIYLEDGKAEIDGSKCNDCGACLNTCPNNALQYQVPIIAAESTDQDEIEMGKLPYSPTVEPMGAPAFPPPLTRTGGFPLSPIQHVPGPFERIGMGRRGGMGRGRGKRQGRGRGRKW
ncbi:4Fe-4S binding protein [candidate division KSB1 bacterium]|nr:4Fe-4S binding protein [candidate division KSB1 bacterium]